MTAEVPGIPRSFQLILHQPSNRGLSISNLRLKLNNMNFNRVNGVMLGVDTRKAVSQIELHQEKTCQLLHVINRFVPERITTVDVFHVVRKS